MMKTNDERIEPADPESEACFEALKARIVEALGARVAFGDDPHTPEGRDVLAELIAGAVLDVFVVRERTSPRWRTV
jgi:hypothetical protein